ncbi:MAG: Branched-chain-amino-acid aminotransferase [Elusimicrobia bacterium]|nr:Branched-chain-amino-acid aminotransferase [Elusimicrobiota bacterium]
MTDNKIYIDGKWFPKREAKISVFDHGFLYGDGVFEGIRAYHGHIFRLEEHIRRIERSARMISLKIPMTSQQLSRVVKESIKKNNLNDAYIRLLITRGVGDLGLDPRACPRASVVVIADKLRLFPAECYEKGLESIIAKTRRNFAEALDPSIKSMNYLNNIQAKIEAVRKNVPEAIMLNKDGYVCECTGDNVFFVKGKTIGTPPVKAGVLVGITRGVVMEIIRKKTTYKIIEKLFYPEALFSADEVFFTGTAAEIIPVTKINGRVIGNGRPGQVTLHLINLFKKLVQVEAGIQKP